MTPSDAAQSILDAMAKPMELATFQAIIANALRSAFGARAEFAAKVALQEYLETHGIAYGVRGHDWSDRGAKEIARDWSESDAES